ncbi:MFS transporter [Caldivirga maquilingensis]|uniref:Major facilitator superfamily MFS_1 n=1 Tax=Caldivirga maquilingensis (strain ATCC 700844 / DSM 13496 / JCM 10307 / IC-167) TaxID=397948 RepID=A8MA15_CALMQ|nr:MFS transporter [Caldivirga maquilingensis]ABW02486.1 major facilitator superfamily MFS_1 [Caldivirga maquilingensis IC-167]
MQFKLNASIELVLLIAYALMWSVVPLYALFSVYILYASGLTLIEIGLFSTLYNIASMMGQYSLGYLSDIVKSRRRVIIIDLLTVSLITLLLMLNPRVNYYMVASVLMGFLAGGFSTLMLASSSEISVIRLGRNISVVRIGGAIGWIGGSLIIPLIIVKSSLRYALVFALIETLIAFTIVALMLKETYSTRFTARLTLSTWTALSLYSLIAGLTISSASWFLPVYVFTQRGSILYLGEVIAAGAAAEVPVMIITGKLFDSSLMFRRYLFIINGAVLSLAFTLYSLVPLNTLYLAQVIRGIGYALFIISTPALLMSLGVERGKGSAVFFTMFSMGSILGGLIGGAVSTVIGVRNLFILLSVFFLVVSLIMNMALRSRVNELQQSLKD